MTSSWPRILPSTTRLAPRSRRVFWGGLSRNYRALSVELRRRLSNRWSMRLELIANVNVDPEDITYDARRDSFLAFDFNYNF